MLAGKPKSLEAYRDVEVWIVVIQGVFSAVILVGLESL